MQIYKLFLETNSIFAKRVKYAVFLTLFAVLTTFVSAQTVRLPHAEMTISTALSSLEKQTGYRFTLDNAFDITKQVKLPITPTSFGEIMKIILKDSDRTYTIYNHYVLIKEIPTPVVTPKQPIVAKTPTPSIPAFKAAGSVSSDGAPVYGSVVSLSADGQKPFITTTNIEGEFEFANVPAGEYKLNASHLDYGSVSSQAAINQGTKEFNIALPTRAAQTPQQSINANLRTVSVKTKDLVHGIGESKQQVMPMFAIKTNIIYDALTNINLGFEVRLGRRLTLDVPVNYNPWVFSDNKRLNNILVQPELRWWIAEPFNGHFFGLHGHFAHFNTGGITAPFGLWKEWQTSRYQGDLYGVGISYGYQWILSRRLNLEGTFGVGYFHAKYDRFECQNCGEPIGKGLSKNYFGPTKVGLSLIYIIK